MTVNKAIRNFLLTASFIFYFSVCAFAEEQSHKSEQVVNVLVTNSSQNGAGVANCPVQVTLFKDNKQIKQVSSLTDAQGLCTFKDLPDGEVFAVAEAMSNNIAFSSNAIKLTHKHESHELQIRVYDVSFDTGAIKSETHHIILKSIPNKILVTEYVQIVNDTNTAISSNFEKTESKPAVIEIKLPRGFQQLKLLQYFNPKATVISDDGFHDTMAIAPGRFNAAYSYVLPVDSGNYDFSKKLTLNTKEVTVFAQLGGGKITGLGESSGQVVIQDGTEADYYTFEVGQDNELSFKVSGLMVAKPAEKTTDANTNVTTAAIITVVAIVIAGAAVFIFATTRKKQKV